MEHLNAIFIKEFMTQDPLSLGPDQGMADAYEMMQNHHIRHVPVVNDKGEIIGIFSATDLNRAYTPRHTEEGWYYDKEGLSLLDLHHFMTKDPLTLTPDNTLKEAAEVLASTKFGCLPVVAPGTKKLVGIVSYIDILKEIVRHF